MNISTYMQHKGFVQQFWDYG